MDPYTPLIKQVGARPRGHCDVWPARIITDYRLCPWPKRYILNAPNGKLLSHEVDGKPYRSVGSISEEVCIPALKFDTPAKKCERGSLSGYGVKLASHLFSAW